ncbi:MAG: hypothetical protein LBS01_02440 [Prevotellaceae bacterium]|jgi:chromosomal replication initiation ATPase DnaA|nr:hypothetical protein [Prevotellaceae bacterium]
MEDLLKIIAEISGLNIAQITSERRYRQPVFCRMIFSNIAIWQLKYGIRDVASFINRKRTTVSDYLKKYDDEYKYNKEFRAFADKVIAKMKNP